MAARTSATTSSPGSWRTTSSKKPATMKAIAVLPGQPNSMHLRDVPRPSVADVPGGRGVLVKVLRVGVDGTDKEINAAEYGAALVKRYCEERLAGGAKVRPEDCSIFEVRTGEVYHAPASSLRRMKEIEAACEEIALRWPTA